jgi:hypothetical protein
MANHIRTIRTFSDGSYSVENASINLPQGYFLAQIGEFQQAPSGNPAVITLRDLADTVYNEQWQLFHYAHNFGMSKNNACHPFSYKTALANRTGFGNPDNPKRNYITGENLNSSNDMYIDKLRTFALNTHAVKNYDEDHYQVWTMDGSVSPIMKPGKRLPSSVADIDSGKVKSTDYLYNPKETLFAFLICNNFNTKPGNLTSISPFDNGLKYDWTPDPNEIYTFVPLVSKRKEPVLSEKRLWKQVSSYQSPYRRI